MHPVTALHVPVWWQDVLAHTDLCALGSEYAALSVLRSCVPLRRTFAMVKPDAVGNMGQVVQAVEAAGFTIRCSPAVCIRCPPCLGPATLLRTQCNQ